MNEPTQESKSWGSWRQFITGNFARRVSIENMNELSGAISSVIPYGDSILLSANGDGSDLLITRPKISGSLSFSISGLGADTINLSAIIDSGQTIETPALSVIDLLTGQPVLNNNLGNGDYSIINVVSYFWHITKSGTDTPLITYLGD